MAMVETHWRAGAGFIVVWLVCFIGCWQIVTTSDPNIVTYREILKNPAYTTGVVTATAPEQHNSVSYTFVANGTTFSGGGFSESPNPDASELRVGGPVSIVYSADLPTFSCACSPSASLKANSLIFFLWGALCFIPAVLAYRVIDWFINRPRRGGRWSNSLRV